MPLTAQLTLLHPLLAVVLIVGAMVITSILGFLLVHRCIPVKIRKIHNDVAGFVFATIGVAYGVLLGLLVLDVWAQFDKVQANVDNESSVTLLLYENIDAYPNQLKSKQMKEALLEYARQALDEHEQVVSRTEVASGYPVGVVSPVSRLLTSTVMASAQGHNDNILNGTIVENLNELTKYRNLRIQAAQRGLPGSIWIAVIAGAVITIGFTFLFGTENVWAHITIISMLAALIAVNIYVVIEFEYPFRGYTVVDPPEGFKLLLEKAQSP